MYPATTTYLSRHATGWLIGDLLVITDKIYVEIVTNGSQSFKFSRAWLKYYLMIVDIQNLFLIWEFGSMRNALCPKYVFSDKIQ